MHSRTHRVALGANQTGEQGRLAGTGRAACWELWAK
jgi:hypothetical protein